MKDQAKLTMVQFVEDGSAESVLERMPGFFKQAADYGSDLIVFPEYMLGRRISLQSETSKRFLELAREHRMYAIGGLIEQMGERWATVALMVDRDGELMGRYLKTHPACGPAPFYWPPVEGNDDEARGILGDEFKVWSLDFGKVGILQCYDGYFPEAWGCTSYEGAEIILWINGRSGMVQDTTCICMAQSYACVVGGNISNGHNTGFAEPMYGRYLTAEGEREDGRLFPRIPSKGEGCVHATIHLDRVRRLRKHHRMAHQRRPDLYSALCRDATIWKAYPDIDWEHSACAELTNKAKLPWQPAESPRST